MPDEAVYYREVTSVTLYGSIFIANNDDGVVVGVTAGFHGDAQFAVIGGFPLTLVTNRYQPSVVTMMEPEETRGR